MAKRVKKSKENKGKISAPLSMTGFGKASLAGDGINIDVEIRSLNNRYLDCNLKIPRVYGVLEEELRQVVASKITRGRLEVSITRQVPDEDSSEISFHPGIFEALFKVYSSEAVKHKVYNDNFKQQLIIHLLGRRDVLEVAEISELSVEEKRAVLRVLTLAVERLVDMRAREGARLAKDITSRIFTLSQLRKQGEKESASFPRIFKDKLAARLKNISNEISLDPSRLATEAVLLAEKWDISEELVRIESHLKELSSSLALSGSGKKMDFLLQELGREFNTIGSKASTGKIASCVVAAKVEIEKIKEQVQNLE